jgi:hypothetical protein
MLNTTTAILSLDLSKYKSAACFYRPAGRDAVPSLPDRLPLPWAPENKASRERRKPEAVEKIFS